MTKIHLTGPAAHILGQNHIEVNLPATCEAILQRIKSEKPELASLRLQLSVNGSICPGTTLLQPATNIVLVSPFAGG
jgi:molybdopterin converting factor small subunit